MSQENVNAPVQVLDPMEQIFDAVLPGFFRPLQGGNAAAPRPNIAHLDVIDRDNEIVVKAEIAGVDKGAVRSPWNNSVLVGIPKGASAPFFCVLICQCKSGKRCSPGFLPHPPLR